MKNMPEGYKGREQSYVKHTVLKSYLERLFMIVGRNREPVINYVDCFAGPWQENDEKLSDTSIGISLAQIEQCRKGLFDRHGHKVKFRALYIEKDPTAFAKLQAYLANSPYQDIEACCFEGDYTDLLNEIVEWCGQSFTFFFVDPKGWLNVGANSMKPLLHLPRAEFLITLMYDFVNRAATIARHEKDMLELFGEVPQLAGSSPQSRQLTQLQLYRNLITSEYQGRSAYVPIEKPGKERVHYFLIYLTRNAIGLKVFMEVAEKMEILQKDVHVHVKLRNKADTTGMDDLFFGSPEPAGTSPVSTDLQAVKDFLVNRLGGQDVRLDYELWADLLEGSDYFPSELQAAMKLLVNEGIAKNLDASVQRRSKHAVKPDYPNKSERWRLEQPE